MLYITDESRLEDFGFKREGGTSWKGRPIYSKEVARFRDNRVYLVVNPYKHREENAGEAEMVLEVYIDRDGIKDFMDDERCEDFGMELTLDMETIFDMMAAGVLAKADAVKEDAA